MLSFLNCLEKSFEPAKWVKGTTAIVTGGNSGIGLETVKKLRKFGVNVIIGCRDVEKGKKSIELIETIQGKGKELGLLSVLKLDLSDFNSIKEFVEEFGKKHTKLDILVNNAGTSMNGKHIDETTKYSVCFQTNYLGPVYLTNLLKTYLLSSPNGRIINLSSVTHRNGDNKFELSLYGKNKDCYSATKLAITMFGREFQRRLIMEGKKNLKVVNVNPGGVYSNIWRRWGALYNCLFKMILLTPEQGCTSSVYGATSDDIEGGEYITVNYIPSNISCLTNICDSVSLYAGFCKANYSDKCNAENELELWDKTEKWIADGITAKNQ